jgi:uncharacterized membrane protein
MIFALVVFAGVAVLIAVYAIALWLDAKWATGEG